MDDKKQLIDTMLKCTRRIIDKHARIDDLPLHFEDGMDLSPREVRTVEFIGVTGGTNVTAVAEHFHFTKSAASQLVARLVDRGFVRKQASARSNKEVLLTLTPSGVRAHQAFESLMAEHLKRLHERMEAFSVHQVSAASVLLEVMEGVIDETLERLT